MAITKEKKKLIWDKVLDAARSYTAVVFAGFQGLTVADVSAVRRDLRKEGVKYSVVKKTIAAKALKESSKMAGEFPDLPGQVALVYGGQDALTAARGVATAAKSYQGKLSILGGIYEGRFVDKAFMAGLAAIPPRQTLLAQFVNVINSPIQGLAVVLDGIAKKRA